MDRKVRFVQYGCGRMGINTTKYAVEKGAELVAAFDMNPAVIGKKASEHFGIADTDVVISDAADAEQIFQELKPDVCIITTRSLMKDLREIMLTCANHGVNAITTCEEAIYPWNSSPAITKEIDEAAKAHNCTITGTGGNEFQYGGMFAIFGANTHIANKIVAKAQYNVDDYGIALAKGHGVGLTPEEFQKQIAAADDISEEERAELIEKGEFLPSYVWNTNGWFCDYLGLTVKKQIQKCTPKFSDKDITSKTLGEVIPAGNAIGMGAVAITETEEGITLETECIGIVYGENDEDVNTSYCYGVPNGEIIVRKPATVEQTCAIIVNRIPDVINAEPGYVTTSKMPVLKYRVKDLNYYCK